MEHDHIFYELRREPPRNQSGLALVVYLVGPSNASETGKYLGPGRWHVTMQNEVGSEIPAVTLRVEVRDDQEVVSVVETEGASRELDDGVLPDYRFAFMIPVEGVEVL